MGCKRVQRQLKAFADGELSPRRRAKVGRHLDGCGACRDVLGEIEGLSSLLATYEEIEPVRGLADAVLARARRPAKHSYPLVVRYGAPLRALLGSPVGWATAGVFLAGILTGHVLTTSAKQDLSPGQQVASHPVVDLEIFSEVPPYSLEQVYWEALPADGEDAA